MAVLRPQTPSASPPWPTALWAAPLGIVLALGLFSALAPPLPPPAGAWPGTYVATLAVAAAGAVALLAALLVHGVRAGRLLYDLAGAVDARERGDAHFRWLTLPELLNLFLLYVYTAGALELLLLLASELRAYDGIVAALASTPPGAARVWHLAHLALYLGLTLGFGLGATSYAIRSVAAELLTSALGIGTYLFNALLVSALVTVLTARRERERQADPRPAPPAAPPRAPFALPDQKETTQTRLRQLAFAD